MVVFINSSSHGFSCKSDFLLMKIREHHFRPHERGRMRKPKTWSPVRRHLYKHLFSLACTKVNVSKRAQPRTMKKSESRV